jgi:uncharacterized membrane protein YfcA
MTVEEAILVAVAAFFAGGINAIAGGGTLIGFPVLIAIGYSSKVANVTNTIGIWPGTLGGSIAYRGVISQQRERVKALLIPAIVGALCGSALLLATPENVFDAVVPFLILGACAVLALQDRITARVLSEGHPLAGARYTLLLQIATFFVGIYGGYFGAAMGIVMLAVFGLFLPDDIQQANALKGFLSLVINGVAVVYFTLFADVAWEAAIVMVLAALAGGFAGGSVAQRLPRGRLRTIAVVYGTIAAVALFFNI